MKKFGGVMVCLKFTHVYLGITCITCITYITYTTYITFITYISYLSIYLI